MLSISVLYPYVFNGDTYFSGQSAALRLLSWRLELQRAELQHHLLLPETIRWRR